MLADISRASHIYIVCGYTDVRKSIDGLCAVIQDQLQMNPSGSSLFLFCGRRTNRIKGLIWEDNRFLLLYKRPENGTLSWPRTPEEAAQLTPEQYR